MVEPVVRADAREDQQGEADDQEEEGLSTSRVVWHALTVTFPSG